MHLEAHDDKGDELRPIPASKLFKHYLRPQVRHVAGKFEVHGRHWKACVKVDIGERYSQLHAEIKAK